jgi:hypothetical protein
LRAVAIVATATPVAPIHRTGLNLLLVRRPVGNKMRSKATAPAEGIQSHIPIQATTRHAGSPPGREKAATA